GPAIAAHPTGRLAHADTSVETRVKGYPCPVCANTVIPGVRYTFPRLIDPNIPSSGKLVSYPAIASGSIGTVPAMHVGDCYNCKGTGVVAERRHQGERRRGDDRRRA